MKFGLPTGSVAVPEKDILADPANEARLFQEAPTQPGVFGPASGTCVLLRSSRPENKQPKRRRSFVAGETYNRAKTTAPVISGSWLSTESLPSLVGEHPTTSTAFDAASSYSSTPSTSFPSSPTPAIATSFPSSSTLPPAIATSSPPAASSHEGDAPPPESPVDGNLGQNYAAPSEDPYQRRNVTLSVSTECNMLSQPVELANYL
ncbi:uncharacterized protein [Nicotiana tomentosiformis]|uniref:uncharacterized protein n=1 Tax=Nicotiana tomentosiformis TaxID=4098 RepID=UPI00388C5BF2